MHDAGSAACPTAKRPSHSYAAIKRLLDLILASAVLGVFAPLWLAVALAIRITSPGPALFQRQVIGLCGSPFIYYKFRTMRQGDDSHHLSWITEYVTNDAPYNGRTFKVTNDPRVTSVGRFLRRTSLDEIPQLINVLKGDMSIVGPRPPIPHEYALYDDRARQRLTVKPGITGLYQVTARSSVPFSRMVAIDLEYIRRRSVRLDLAIMFRTVKVMVSGFGAG